jgi:peptide/nickel transport system ATP-binding protein
MALLEVKNLRTYYTWMGKCIKAVDDVSFDVEYGESLGLVGESGCGKSSVGLSILRVLPPNGMIVGGQVVLEGSDLVTMSLDEIRKIRWKKISMVFQQAMSGLDPVFRVRDQLVEALQAHENISVAEARERASKAFDLVGLPSSRIDAYPHQLSGGMKQRVLIAMAIICDPNLIIADEATSALDVIVKDGVLKVLEDLRRKLNISMIMVTHDISDVAETCNKIGIMYVGKMFEYGDTVTVLKNPRNPYTVALLESYPSIHGPLKQLESIPGAPPTPWNLPTGCIFERRCPLAEEICKKESPPMIEVAKKHYSRCHFA